MYIYICEFEILRWGGSIEILFSGSYISEWIGDFLGIYDISVQIFKFTETFVNMKIITHSWPCITNLK